MKTSSKTRISNFHLKIHIVSFFTILILSTFLTQLSYPDNKEEKTPSAPDKEKKVETLGIQTFDASKAGENYGLLDVSRDFQTIKSWGTIWPFNRVRVVERKDEGGTALQVKYPKGKIRSRDSGASWFWKYFGNHKDLYLSFWVKFEEGFNFRAGGKLHGLTGGSANTGGNKPNGHDGWSSRMHWGENGIIKQYIYHKDQAGQYGDVIFWEKEPKPFVVGIHKSTEPAHDKGIFAIPGKWHFIETRVFVNDIGNKNGCVQSWFDSKLVLEVYGLEFRDSTCKADELLVDAMYFSTFFGGNDDRYRPVKDEYALFDNFRITRNLFSPPKFTSEAVKPRVILRSVQPKLFTTNETDSAAETGYGMTLEWINSPNLSPAFYEIRFAAEHEFALTKWRPYKPKPTAAGTNSINHQGNIQFDNYNACLKSGEKYFYQIRALDADRKPMTGWSNIESGIIDTYNSVRLEYARPRLYDMEISPGKGKYGYGVQLRWTASPHADKMYYHVQFTTDPNLSENTWQTFSDRVPLTRGETINHLGDVVYNEYKKCLPSNQRYFYRVHTLDKDGQPLDDWSNIQTARVQNYANKQMQATKE